MNVYLKAAKTMSEFWFSCHAISEAAGGACYYIDKPTVKAYVAIFSKDGEMDTLTNDVDKLKDRMEWRLTALCFAAAMHDTGDL